jgi:hypothetical protein
MKVVILHDVFFFDEALAAMQEVATVTIMHDDSREALLAEHALRCVARPRESAHWGYQAARQYAERYNPRYGPGLIPESAPAVEHIVAYWARYHFGRDAKKVLALANHAQPGTGCGYPTGADVEKIKPENLVKYKTAPEGKRLHKGCPK